MLTGNKLLEYLNKTLLTWNSKLFVPSRTIYVEEQNVPVVKNGIRAVVAWVNSQRTFATQDFDK